MAWLKEGLRPRANRENAPSLRVIVCDDEGHSLGMKLESREANLLVPGRAISELQEQIFSHVRLLQ